MDKVLTEIGVDNYINNKLKIDPSTGVIDPAVSGVDHIVTIKITDPSFTSISADSSTLQFSQFEYYPDYETIKSWGSSIKLEILTPNGDEYRNMVGDTSLIFKNYAQVSTVLSGSYEDETEGTVDLIYIYASGSAYFDGIENTQIFCILSSSYQSDQCINFLPSLSYNAIGNYICPLNSGKIDEKYLPPIWVTNILKNGNYLTGNSIGMANGIAPLNSSRHIDSSWLPVGTVVSKTIAVTIGDEIPNQTNATSYKLGVRYYNITLSVDISELQLYDRIYVNSGTLLITEIKVYSVDGIFIKNGSIYYAHMTQSILSLAPSLSAQNFVDSGGILMHTIQLTEIPTILSGLSGKVTIQKPETTINEGDIVKFVYNKKTYITAICTSPITTSNTKITFYNLGGFVTTDQHPEQTATFSGSFAPNDLTSVMFFVINADFSKANKADGPLILDSSGNIPENLLPTVTSDNNGNITIFQALTSDTIDDIDIDNDTVYDYTAPVTYCISPDETDSIDISKITILVQNSVEPEYFDLYLYVTGSDNESAKLYKNWTNRSQFTVAGPLINCINSNTGYMVYQYDGAGFIGVSLCPLSSPTTDEISKANSEYVILSNGKITQVSNLIKSKNTYISVSDLQDTYSTFLTDLIDKPLTEIGGGILYKFIQDNIPDGKFIVMTELGSPFMSFERIDFWMGAAQYGLLLTSYLTYDAVNKLGFDSHIHQLSFNWSGPDAVASVAQCY